MTERNDLVLSPGEVKPWIEENWKTVRCYFGGAAALATTAYKAVSTLRGQPQNVWGVINDAVMAGTWLSDCFIEDPQMEQYFPESEEECQCASAGGQLWASVTTDGVVEKIAQGDRLTAKEIIETVYDKDGDAICQYTTTNGTSNFAEVTRPESAGQFSVYWYISPAPGSVCCGEQPKAIEEPEAPPPFEFREETDNQPEFGCQMGIYLIDSEVDHRGILWNKYKVEPLPGCQYSHSRFCYWESRTGIFFPNTCEDGLPFPAYEEPCYQPTGLNGVQYRLHVPCTWDEQEQGFTDWIDYDIEQTDDPFLGLARRIDGIAYLLDRAVQFPYRECDVKPQLEGDWVTTRWKSDQAMEHSGTRLRKLFRYRSKSTRSLPELSAYWVRFTWEAGPVCVIHKDAWWGSPQVWAESEEEGKRVIRHAAAEAGLDPDQVGRWSVSSSRSPRCGMSGTMRIQLVEGFPWVASRQGSEWPNQVARLNPG